MADSHHVTIPGFWVRPRTPASQTICRGPINSTHLAYAILYILFHIQALIADSPCLVDGREVDLTTRVTATLPWTTTVARGMSQDAYRKTLRVCPHRHKGKRENNKTIHRRNPGCEYSCPVCHVCHLLVPCTAGVGCWGNYDPIWRLIETCRPSGRVVEDAKSGLPCW